MVLFLYREGYYTSMSGESMEEADSTTAECIIAKTATAKRARWTLAGTAHNSVHECGLQPWITNLRGAVLAFARKAGLFCPGDRVIVAARAGPTHGPLQFLLRYRNGWAFAWEAVHVDHRLRPELARWRSLWRSSVRRAG